MLCEGITVSVSHLDCHGVMTPSSGPPIITRFFIRIKFSLYTGRLTVNIRYKIDCIDIDIYISHVPL